MSNISHRQFVCRALFPNGLPPIYECPLEHNNMGVTDIEGPATSLETKNVGFTAAEAFDGLAGLYDLLIRCVARCKTLEQASRSSGQVDSNSLDIDQINTLQKVFELAEGWHGEGEEDMAKLQDAITHSKKADEILSRIDKLRIEGKTVRGDLTITSLSQAWPTEENASANRQSLEHDFTTTRKQGSLGCPFAAKPPAVSLDPVSNQLQNWPPTPKSARSYAEGVERAPKRKSFDKVSRSHAGKSPSVSATGSAPACPIRYMDQHSPEEIAKYFEEHKHELPRSHEICVKRFQDNTASIKQLDAKYGDLVSMIQGLGQKHQPMLANNHESEHPSHDLELKEEGQKTDKKVQIWAKGVSESVAAEDGNDEQQDDEEMNENAAEKRESRFDRPLKEVRVGESPSRPWGVSIPAKYLDKASSTTSSESSNRKQKQVDEDMSREHGHAAKQITQESPSAALQGTSGGKCPFDHTKFANKTPVQAVGNSKNSKMTLKQRETTEPDSDIAPAHEEDANEPAPRRHNYRYTDEKTLEEKETAAHAPPKAPRNRIVNRGLMVVAEGMGSEVELTNEGELILGFTGTGTREILESRFFRRYD